MAKRVGDLVLGETFNGDVAARYKEGEFGQQVEVTVTDPETERAVIGWFKVKTNDDGDVLDIRGNSAAFAVLDSVREATGQDYFKQDEGPAEFIVNVYSERAASGIRLDKLGKMNNVMIFKGDGGGTSTTKAQEFEDEADMLAYAATVADGQTVQAAKATFRKDASLDTKPATLLDQLTTGGYIVDNGGTLEIVA